MTRKSRALGSWTLVALVVANMIGAGVFTTSGFALGDLGSPLRVLAAWLIGGVLAVCGALSYGALARLVPDSGGEYLYLSRTIHPGVGFIAGWISLLAGFTAAIAYSALTFAAYAMPGGDAEVSARIVASLVIAVAVALHVLHVRQGAWIQNVVVAVKLVLMLAFCALAVLGPGISAWEGLAEVRAQAYEIPRFSIATFALTLMWVSFSYLGFNAAVYLAGEVPEARRQVPRALLLGTVLTMAVYLMLNTVFVLVPSFEAAAFQEDIAAIAAQAAGGDLMAGAVRLIVALALFTSVSAMIMVGPRVYAKMADDGVFPPVFRFSGETPAAAIVVQAALAMIVVWITGLRELLSYLGFTLGLSTAATVASLFVASRGHTASAGPLPGYPWAPAIFVVLTLLFAGLAATVNPWEMLAAVLTIASGALLYLLLRGRWDLAARG
ncbi:MAG TPA: amino acid permease [Gammaproteobacteria bacterium]|nr:amino acid permease [Gammaproteobacteria bacterium]